MTKFILSIIGLITTLGHIIALELKSDLKYKILKTYFWVIFLKRFGFRNNIVDVADHKIMYCTYNDFLYLFREIFINQDYYFNTKNISPIIIDCGSNIGLSVLYFKLIYPNSEIIAFEPDEDAFLCLKTNVEINQLDSIDIINKALSKKDGPIDFFYNGDHPGSLTGIWFAWTLGGNVIQFR